MTIYLFIIHNGMERDTHTSRNSSYTLGLCTAFIDCTYNCV